MKEILAKYYAIENTVVNIWPSSVINDGIEGNFIIPSSFNLIAYFDKFTILILPLYSSLV